MEGQGFNPAPPVFENLADWPFGNCVFVCVPLWNRQNQKARIPKRIARVTN